LVAVVTCTISPVLFGRLLPPAPTNVRQGTLIIGTDPFASRLAERLRQHGEGVALIHPADPAPASPSIADMPVHSGDPTRVPTLLAAGIEQASAVVILAGDPAQLRTICAMARERFAVPTVVARVDDPALAQELASQGVQTVQPAFATLMALEGAVRFPAAFALLADQEDGIEVGDARLTRPEALDTPIRAIQLPGGVRLLGIRRGHDVVVPQGSTILRRDDVLMVIGSRAGIQEAQAWLNPLNASAKP
ncbi:MAG TPA: TrkA family potassium uptake protein, partial [Herpetosiphonaceae bacterium]